MATQAQIKAKEEELLAQIKEIEDRYDMKLGEGHAGRKWDQYTTKWFQEEGLEGSVDKRLPEKDRVNFKRGDKTWKGYKKDFEAAGNLVYNLKSQLTTLRRTGTITPKAARNLENARAQLKISQNDNSALTHIRRALSKTTVSGKKRFDLQIEDYQTKKKAEIKELEKQTWTHKLNEEANLDNIVKDVTTKSINSATKGLIDQVEQDNEIKKENSRQRLPMSPTVNKFNIEADQHLAELNNALGESDPKSPWSMRRLQRKGIIQGGDTSDISIDSSQEAPKERLKMPDRWARGQGRSLKDVNKDTEAYLRQEGWGEALDKSRDKDELLRDARTDRLLIAKGFVHTNDGVFKLKPDKKDDEETDE